MEKAKQAAREFLSGDGKHKTTVDQDTRGAVTHEQIKPHQHEEVTTAVDKEVHQEHHQTRIQPVKHTETLPEKHTHNVLPTEHKTIHHGREGETRQTLERDAAKYQDTSTTHEATHSTSAMPTMGGERIHHHVHEHIQPVVERETHQPHVVHTTAPVHETHHAAPVHHETTTLPPKTMQEFSGGRGQAGLGAVGSHTLREYEGCPQPYSESPDAQRLIHGEGGGLGSSARGENLTGSTGYGENMPAGMQEGQSHHRGGLGAAGAAGATAAAGGMAAHHHHKKNRNKLERTGSSSSSSSSSSDHGPASRTRGSKAATTGAAAGTGAGLGAGAGAGAGTGAGSGLGSSAAGIGGPASGPGGATTGLGNTTTATSQQRKPSLKDRLNPRKDADGDGKAGFFS